MEEDNRSIQTDTLTIQLDSLRPGNENVIEYEIPNQNNYSSTSTSEQHDSNNPDPIPDHHATQSNTVFLPSSSSSGSFIRTSIINQSKTLELRYFNPFKQQQHQENQQHPLDQLSSHPPIQFRFPSQIISSIPHISTTSQTQEEEETLIILILTKSSILYRLKFISPLLFYSELFEEDWVTESCVESIINRQIISSYSLDQNNLILGCSDGTILHLSYGKVPSFESDHEAWREIELRSDHRSRNWSNLLPFNWSSSNSNRMITSSSNDFGSDLSSVISITSHVTVGSNVEEAYIFTISRDRQLTIYSLLTTRSLKTIDLSPTTQNQDRSPLPGFQRNLCKFVYADEGDDPTYEGFLIVYLPSLNGGSTFLSFGMVGSFDHGFGGLNLLEERVLESHGNELRDFGISRIDLFLGDKRDQESLGAWKLWTVWDDRVGGAGVIRSIVLNETRIWEKRGKVSDWITYSTSSSSSSSDEQGEDDGQRAWDSSFFDSIIGRRDRSRFSIQECLIEHLFRPGNYSASTLEHSIEIYQSQLSISQNSTDREDFESLEEKICSIVGSNVLLTISDIDGSAMLDGFESRIRLEWMRFGSIASEVRSSSMFPIELTIDERSGSIYVMGRRSISLPIVLNVEEPKKRDDQRLLNRAIDRLLDGNQGDQMLDRIGIALEDLIRRPIRWSWNEVLEDLFSRSMEEFIDDDLQARVSSEISLIGDLPLAIERFLESLMGEPSCETEGEEEEEEEEKRLSILSQMFVTEHVRRSISSKLRNVRRTMVFLLYVYGEEEIEEIFGPNQGFEKVWIRWMRIFRSIWLISFVDLQLSKVPGEMIEEGSDEEVREEVWDEEARCSIGLMNSLIITRFDRVFFRNGCSVSELIHRSGTRFLNSIIGGGTSITKGIDDQRFKTEVWEIELLMYLIRFGLIDVVFEALDRFGFDKSPGVEYLLGQVFLGVGRVEEAEESFVRAGSALYDPNFEMDDLSGLSKILPPGTTNLSTYYSHIVHLFESRGLDLQVIRFCEREIDEVDDDDEGRLVELYGKIFRCWIRLRDWDEAYRCLVSIPITELKHNCLRTLITNMCESKNVDRLLRYTFQGLESEFERTISFRARNSDPMSLPNYDEILYAYHVTRGDYRSAGIAMYQHGRRIGDLIGRGNGVGDGYQILMTQQCQSYLASINALSLVPISQAWIPIGSERNEGSSSTVGYGRSRDTVEGRSKDQKILGRKMRGIVYHLPKPDERGGGELEIISLKELRREYTISLMRLELSNELTNEFGRSYDRSIVQLDGQTMIPMIMNNYKVRESIVRSNELGLELSPIFKTLVEWCMKVGTSEGETKGDWISGDEGTVGLEGSDERIGWKILERLLNVYGTTEDRIVVFESIVASQGKGMVPIWLYRSLIDRDVGVSVERLGRIFLRYGFVEDAFTVLVEDLLKKEKEKKKGRYQIPIGYVDELMNLEFDEDLMIEGGRLEELKSYLRSLVIRAMEDGSGGGGRKVG